MARLRWFLIISGVLVLVVFSLANTASVPVGMPFVFHADVPLAMLLALSALIGFMIGSLWTVWMLRRKSPPSAKGDTSKAPPKSPIAPRS
jgi:uncharacterized integral membrane protein